MKCRVCGSGIEPVVTDLPFKKGTSCIVIVKGLPVLQCRGCGDFLIEDPVMEWVEKTLSGVSSTAELEIVRYAA